METRRFWVDGRQRTQSAQCFGGDEALMPLIWRCRTMWYRLRCGKPGLAEQVDGLPDFALVPIAAAGDAQGNLREMECEMITMDTSIGDKHGSMGKLYIVACETSNGRSWFVCVEPQKNIARDVEEACLRFGTFFAAALQLDKVLN